MVVLFDVDASAEDIAQAVASLLENPENLPSLSLKSVNINGRTYSNPNDDTSSGGKETSASNIGLIVGLVVGLVVLVLIVAGIMFQRVYKKKFSRQKLLVRPSVDIDLNELGRSNATLPRGSMNSLDGIIPAPAWALATPDPERRTPLVSPQRSRNPSIDVSVHLSQHDELNEQPLPPPLPRKLPPLKLIDFD